MITFDKEHIKNVYASKLKDKDYWLDFDLPVLTLNLNVSKLLWNNNLYPPLLPLYWCVAVKSQYRAIDTHWNGSDDLALSNKCTHLPHIPLTCSLFLWPSYSGTGHRGWYRFRGHHPHHHRVLQEVQEEETEAGGERGGSPQSEERPYSVVRPRAIKTRGKERGKEEWNHTLPLSLSV